MGDQIVSRPYRRYGLGTWLPVPWLRWLHNEERALPVQDPLSASRSLRRFSQEIPQ